MLERGSRGAFQNHSKKPRGERCPFPSSAFPFEECYFFFFFLAAFFFAAIVSILPFPFFMDSRSKKKSRLMIV